MSIKSKAKENSSMHGSRRSVNKIKTSEGDIISSKGGSQLALVKPTKTSTKSMVPLKKSSNDSKVWNGILKVFGKIDKDIIGYANDSRLFALTKIIECFR